jgi:hypothetical protein
MQFSAGTPVSGGPSAPSGPASIPTMLAPKRPGLPQGAIEAQPGALADGQPSSNSEHQNGHAAQSAVCLPFANVPALDPLCRDKMWCPTKAYARRDLCVRYGSHFCGICGSQASGLRVIRGRPGGCSICTAARGQRQPQAEARGWRCDLGVAASADAGVQRGAVPGGPLRIPQGAPRQESGLP